MTIVQEVRDIQERAKQRSAIEQHLEKHGSLTLHEARYQGIPGYGIIPHPGAGICDMRADGWEIETKLRPTEWKLVSKPAAKQLSLI